MAKPKRTKKATKIRGSRKPKSVKKPKRAKQVTVNCGVLKNGNMFSMRIALNNTVKDLMKAIVKEMEETNRMEYGMHAFALYWAKDE